MTPASVTLENVSEARNNIMSTFKRKNTNNKRKKIHPFKYRVNDLVRISKTKATFEKGYEANWTKEVFKIKKVKRRQLLPIYELCDLEGEDIDGFFYEQELTLVNKNIGEEEFEIERIIKSKDKGRNKQVFVKWLGYPDKFNS
ncbi:uncharacterized protein LOC128668039 [Microplitis demolitor]|uniref:uncharacterized protein LOC128668039 n=1 Tax=Microplitis demolitor TaxID=69319 RepID=UPI00235B629C|nr:uncharacterized protein LOC128668039 [Microplitis demolitor]